MCSDSELEAAPPEPEWTVGQYVSVPEDMQPGVNRDAGIGRIVEASVDESTKQGVYTVKYIVDNRTYEGLPRSILTLQPDPTHGLSIAPPVRQAAVARSTASSLEWAGALRVRGGRPKWEQTRPPPASQLDKLAL